MTPERKEEIREKYRKAELAARLRPGGLGPDLLLIGELLTALDERDHVKETLLRKVRWYESCYEGGEEVSTGDQLERACDVVEAARDVEGTCAQVPRINDRLTESLKRYDEKVGK